MEKNKSNNQNFNNKLNLINQNLLVNAKLLLKSGVQFGHRKNLCHPQFRKYVFLNRNKINIINLEKTIKYLTLVYNYVYEQTVSGKTILFVGLKKQLQDIVKQEAERANVFYLSKCWKGGTFTNFKIISRQIQENITLEKNLEENLVHQDLTKKEFQKLKKKVHKFNSQFEGIKNMRVLPDMVFLCSPLLEKVVCKEATDKNITVIGIADTNFNPRKLDFFIPANDDGVKSVKLILGVIADAICKAKGLPTAVVNHQNIDIVFNEESKQLEFKEVDLSNEQNSPNYFFSPIADNVQTAQKQKRTRNYQQRRYQQTKTAYNKNWRNNQNAMTIFDFKDKEIPINDFNQVISTKPIKPKKAKSNQSKHSSFNSSQSSSSREDKTVAADDKATKKQN